MKIEKPLTEKMREKANACYRLFRDTDGYLTKSEIGEYLSLKDERQVRDVISLVATKVPIISKSNSKGYKMAKTDEHVGGIIEPYGTVRKTDLPVNKIQR